MLNICFNFIIVHTKHKVAYANLKRETEWKCRDCISDVSAEVIALVQGTGWDSGQDCHFQSQLFALTYTSVILPKRITMYAFINTPLPLGS